MKKWLIAVTAVLTIAAVAWWQWWKADEPRRESVQALQLFCRALDSGDAAALLQSVHLPLAITSRTPAEQTEFLTKALREEIPADGTTVLKREGQLGPLTNLFPAEASAWASQAGVAPEDCVAFEMKPNGQRVEVVLARPATRNPQPSTAIASADSTTSRNSPPKRFQP